MWKYPKAYDVIVVGAGHAGCEAAHAAARMGASTLLVTMNLDTIAKMSCNPAIGGTAKGHLVREIDALGGIMGKIADETSIQRRMLNRSKGPAVWSPRCQSDKALYSLAMKRALEKTPRLDLFAATTETLLIERGRIKGVQTKEGIIFEGKTVILSAGTFMKGQIHLGDISFGGGRSGDEPARGLSKTLRDLGFRLSRLKTGTPPRILASTVDFSSLERQDGEEEVRFSFTHVENKAPQMPCWITYTNQQTAKLAENNLKRSAMFSGKITSKGPRYCPSFEDKIVRFVDKDRHQIFLEPEGTTTDEMYVNGISTSLPFDVQVAMLHTIEGLENCHITRAAYAIEYDYLESGQMQISLEANSVEGLFFAGQINGTTGYEEAAAQGIVAGINATRKVRGLPSVILPPSSSYIGQMLEDLSKMHLTEPYRIFTSRSPYRLSLRQDTADLRLTPLGYELGLIDQKRYNNVMQKKKVIEETLQTLTTTRKHVDGKIVHLQQLLARPEMTYAKLKAMFPDLVPTYDEEIEHQISIHAKYDGYIQREKKEAEKFSLYDNIRIPENYGFSAIDGLSKEAKEKLTKIMPTTLGQVARLEGVTYGDLSLLLVHLKKKSYTTVK